MSAGAIVAYLLYMMIRRRKGERAGFAGARDRAYERAGRPDGHDAISGID